MVAPVTGPVIKTDATALEDRYVYQERYKQRRPYNLALPYWSKHGKTKIYRYPNQRNVANAGFTLPDGQLLTTITETNQAKAIAFERLKSKISDRASMGENLGQLGSSVRLIVEKAKVVKDAITRLRRFDVSAFAAWMDRGFVKRNSRFAAQLTLEINFAIAPSVNDIYSAINILQNPIPDELVKGRASVPFNLVTSKGLPGQVQKIWSLRVSAEYGAKVAISNRNLYLANTLGLINPVQTAWQLLPGSFLFDWFIPIEQFLGYATDLYGLSLSDSFTTTFARGTYIESWTPYPGLPGTDYLISVVIAETKRQTGIILPSLALRPLKTPSLKRAANAVSLVVQAFHK
jgi:hypothetical protein